MHGPLSYALPSPKQNLKEHPLPRLTGSLGARKSESQTQEGSPSGLGQQEELGSGCQVSASTIHKHGTTLRAGPVFTRALSAGLSTVCPSLPKGQSTQRAQWGITEEAQAATG